MMSAQSCLLRKRLLRWTLVLVGVLGTWSSKPHAQQGPCAAGAKQVTISKGFFTGAELNALSDHALAMYAAGYVDALQAATIVGMTERCRRALQTCVTGRTSSDLAAKVRRYLRENPNRWDEQSNGILYNVLFSQCLRGQR